jgi:hypothetical protein
MINIATQNYMLVAVNGFKRVCGSYEGRRTGNCLQMTSLILSLKQYFVRLKELFFVITKVSRNRTSYLPRRGMYIAAEFVNIVTM